jgi:hypothetical protein
MPSDTDDNVVPLHKWQVQAIEALEQDANDVLVAAIDEVILMGLTAAQVTGLLYMNLRRFYEQAEDW